MIKIFNLKKEKGFTLMELLVSIGLFTALAAIIISVLFVSFRASKKSEIIISMKQSGNTALQQIVNGIRFARSLNDPVSCVPSVSSSYIKITGLDYGQTTYSCPTDDLGSISSNSAVLIDDKTIVVDSCSFTCSQDTVSTPPTITIQFKLSANPATNFAENLSSIPFQTTVTLRNFNR